MFKIDHIDHLVLTVASIKRSCEFYERVLGMEVITFGAKRRALAFGNQKINLQEVGQEIDPKAHRPTPGSGDLCLITSNKLDDVIAHLEDNAVEIEEGPIQRIGAAGPIVSVYFRDVDENLIEVSNYL